MDVNAPLDLEAQTPFGDIPASPSGSAGAMSDATVHRRSTAMLRNLSDSRTFVDNRVKPAEIKHKSMTHLHLTDPIRQYGRWYFSLKHFLITEDPIFGRLLDGERGDHLYHYEWCLAKLITFLVKDEDAQYTVGGCIHRH